MMKLDESQWHDLPRLRVIKYLWLQMEMKAKVIVDVVGQSEDYYENLIVLEAGGTNSETSFSYANRIHGYGCEVWSNSHSQFSRLRNPFAQRTTHVFFPPKYKCTSVRARMFCFSVQFPFSTERCLCPNNFVHSSSLHLKGHFFINARISCSFNQCSQVPHG